MNVVARRIDGIAIARLEAPDGGVHLAAEESAVTLCGLDTDDMAPLTTAVGMHLHCIPCIHLLRECEGEARPGVVA